MRSIPAKSRLKYIAHNPTSRLLNIITRLIKAFLLKQKRK